MCFAKLQQLLIRAGRKLGCADHHEQGVVILLQLWSLVSPMRVFDRQVVQTKLLLHKLQKWLTGLVKTNPYESFVSMDRLTDLFRSQLCFATAVRIDRTGDES